MFTDKQNYNKQYYLKNKNKLNSQNKEYRIENKEHLQAVQAERYQQNKEIKQRKRREYYQQNKDKVLEINRNYERKKSQHDPCFRVLKNLRRRLHHALNGKNKSARTLELLGCTIDKLKEHLESQFVESMSWENYGTKGWHIDHIKPCCSFDLSDFEQQKQCFHYSNLQPLWWYDNLSKNRTSI